MIKYFQFAPKWEGPFVIKEVYEIGHFLIVEIDSEEITPPINATLLKLYYP